MLIYKPIKTIFFISIVLFVNFCSLKGKNVTEVPLIWNVENLDILKQDTAFNKVVGKILNVGDKYCSLPPVVVTEKKIVNVVDMHYYCQIRGYYWPDPTRPGKYIKRDGYRYPEYKKYDYSRLTEMAKRCKYLSVSYYLSGNKKYYDSYVKQIKSWFIDKDTYMYPCFTYTGILPNDIMKKGAASGLIQAYMFNEIIESLRLICMKKTIDSVLLNSVRAWFREFVWSLDRDFGDSIKKISNNIGLAHDITLIDIYLFVGEEEKARSLQNMFADKWLYKHIMSDGRQPLELKRASAFGYSVYNLTHIIDFCFLSRYWQMDFYQKHQKRIDKAFNYLEQFRKDTTSFPYRQVSEWKKSLNNLSRQESRLKRLRSHRLAFPNGKRLSIYQVLE